MKILVKTKKVIQTISKLLNELYDSKSEVRIRIDSYEATIDPDGNIIGSKVWEHIGISDKDLYIPDSE